MRTSHTVRQDCPLNDDVLRAVAPSVFAERPYHKVSDRYAFIPTLAVLNGLRNEGWLPVSAQEQRVRLEDKRGFTKHMLRFRHQDARPLSNLGDVYPELVLVNSHDRGSSYILHAGLFRLACLNGMVVSTGDFGSIKVAHTGKDDIVGRVIEGTYEIVKDLPRIIGNVEAMRATELTEPEQVAFAESAMALRWDGQAPVTADQLLTVRRYDDRGPDLWHTFNRVQEGIMKGGLHGVASTGRRLRTRAVGSINEDVRINRALFMLAEKMVELKQTA